MKKLSKILLPLSILTLLLSIGCGPSFCDCNDKYGSLSTTDKEKCDKMVDKMSTSEINEKMQKCKNK